MKIILLLLQAIQIALSDEDDIRLTPVNNPILPIQLGNANIIYSKHTFIHYLDLSPIINQLHNLDKHFFIISNNLNRENATNHISYHALSQDMLLRTEFMIKSTQKKLDNLQPHIRSKRGIIDGIGKLEKWMFGTLDADDGNRYDNAIKILEQNQKNIINEINLQSSLSKNLINNYNKTINILSLNQEKFSNSLEYFQMSVRKTITQLHEYLTFQGIISQINLDCQNIITFIDNLENSIAFAKLNTLHTSIISSKELLNSLEYLRKLYQNNQIPKFNNILTYYQFLGTQVTFSDNKLIFAIHIPIIRAEILTFYRLYPIIQNYQAFIPKYPYLAQSTSKIQFKDEACPLLENTYFCIENQIPEDNCTVQLIKNQSTKNCRKVQLSSEESIIEQITQDQILIIPTRKEEIFSKCRTDQYIEIKSPMLIKLPKSCQITFNNKKFFNDVKIQQGKPLILPKLDIGNLGTIPEYEIPKFEKINLQEIYKISNLAKRLTPIQFSNSNQYPQIFGGLSIAITIILLVLIFMKPIFKKMQNFCNRPNQREQPPDEEEKFEHNSVMFSS